MRIYSGIEDIWEQVREEVFGCRPSAEAILSGVIADKAHTPLTYVARKLVVE